MTAPPPDALRRAIELWQEAYRLQMAGDLDAAVEVYRRSIEVCPTAEAHTFLGWTLSFQGRLEDATRECLRAIELDPDFGNPYNDIGVYLMQQDRLDDAIPWLERAKRAPRYEPRHYPYFNLARVYVRQHKVREAIAELQQAVAIEPRYTIARRELHRLLGMLN